MAENSKWSRARGWQSCLPAAKTCPNFKKSAPKILRIYAANTANPMWRRIQNSRANLAWRVKTKWMLARGRQNVAPAAKTSFKI
jgi:hypothetical protein